MFYVPSGQRFGSLYFGISYNIHAGIILNIKRKSAKKSAYINTDAQIKLNNLYSKRKVIFANVCFSSFLENQSLLILQL